MAQNKNSYQLGNKALDTLSDSIFKVVEAKVKSATEASKNQVKGAVPENHTHSIKDIRNLKDTLDNKVPTSRKINGMMLNQDIELTAADIGALPESTPIPSIEGLASEEYVMNEVKSLNDALKEKANTKSLGVLATKDIVDKQYLEQSVQESLEKADSALQSELDPTVPEWAKKPTKPVYTAAEVGALPADTQIPSVDGLASEKFVEDIVAESAIDLEKKINAIDFPVDSVNGKTGTVVLKAEDVGALPDTTRIPSVEGLASEEYVDKKVADLVDSSPEALDTLNELAQALGDDPNFATTVLTEIGEVAAKIDAVDAKVNSIDFPVDSVNGKTGNVVLTAEDVGALPTVTAASKEFVNEEIADLADSLAEQLDGKVDIITGKLENNAITFSKTNTEMLTLGEDLRNYGIVLQANNKAYIATSILVYALYVSILFTCVHSDLIDAYTVNVYESRISHSRRTTLVNNIPRPTSELQYLVAENGEYQLADPPLEPIAIILVDTDGELAYAETDAYPTPEELVSVLGDRLFNAAFLVVSIGDTVGTRFAFLEIGLPNEEDSSVPYLLFASNEGRVIRVAEDGSLSYEEDILKNNTDVPEYWEEHLATKTSEIYDAMSSAGWNKSAFLWYHDTHWTYSWQMSPLVLRYLSENTPINKTIFGGDIVDAESDDPNEMLYLHQWRSMIRELPNHHSVPGNHDDGNNPDNRFSDEYIYGFLLAAEETPDVVRSDSGLYYYIDDVNEKTRYLYLDTATYDGNIAWNSTQQEWLKKTLLSTPESWHIVAIAHIWRDVDYTVTPHVDSGFSAGGKWCLDLFDAFNARNGEFANCSGQVEFAIGGHTHVDGDFVSDGGIPVILTEADSMYVRSGLECAQGTITEAAVSAIVANYTDRTVSVIRAGRGENRVVSLPEANLGGTDGYTNVLELPEIGWQENMRYSSTNDIDQSADGWDITGYIPVGVGSVVRLKNVVWKITTENSGRGGIDIFDANRAHIGRALSISEEALSDFDIVFDSEGNIVQFTVPNWNEATAYVRICCQDINENSIITVNQVITEPSSETLYATEEYVDAKVLAVVGSAPEGMNTLGELADAIEEKVDRVDGKGLSTEDYTTADKNKLSGISAGAEVNQNTFSKIAVGSTTLSADTKEDILTLVAGNNVTLTPTEGEDKIEISVDNMRYTHPAHSAAENGLYKVAVDQLGHVSEVSSVTKDDITALGIPAENTTYEIATKQTAGIVKLYNSTGYMSDGTITQGALTIFLDGKEKAGAAEAALEDAKEYTDGKISSLINGAPETLDTLKEIADAMAENADVVEALEGAIGSKAAAGDLTDHTGNKSNPHGVTLAQLGVNTSADELNLVDGATSNIQGQIDNINTALDEKAPKSHDHVLWAKGNGDGVIHLVGENGTNGVTFTAAHNKTNIPEGTYKSLTVDEYGHVTAGSNPTTLSGYGITDAASKEHEHSNYVNQNAFSNVKVGSTTVSADSATDTLELIAGDNITLTPDATNDKITIVAKDTVYTHPTNSGNKHIPSGGSSNKILRWVANGEAQWSDEKDTVYTHPAGTGASKSSGFYKFSTDGTSHISGVTAVTKADIVGLGIASSEDVQKYLPLTGGTMGGNIIFDNASATSQAGEPGIKWAKYGGNVPYIGFATNQTDGTFLLGSLTGTTHTTGLAIGGSSGNLLWKGSKVPMNLSDLGVTASADELNYVDGVTSNLQTQINNLNTALNGKANDPHDHTLWAKGAGDGVINLSGENGTNGVTFTASHAKTNVPAATYKSVTVNEYGHVTAGSNPTTLAGYGITDASRSDHTHSNYVTTDLNISNGAATGSLKSKNAATTANSKLAGSNSVSLGNGSLASGSGSIAAGLTTFAQGDASAAFGSGCYATGAKSIVAGSGTEAEGEAAVAFGYGSYAKGKNSIALGNYTVTGTNDTDQLVYGRYNLENNTGTYALIVGNGTSTSARSNCHTLSWTGDAWYAGRLGANTIHANNIQQVLTVGPSGSGKMYTSIQAAINAANAGDTILVAPGTYTEYIELNKNVKVIGEDRYRCCLEAEVTLYEAKPGGIDNAVIRMHQGEIGNMQIRGKKVEGDSLWGGAYCLHIDFSDCAGKSCYIHDVDFVNEKHQAVGIGMWADMHVRFDRCSFRSAAFHSAFYCHSHSTEAYAGQNLYVYDCTFANDVSTNPDPEAVGSTAPVIMETYGKLTGSTKAFCEWVDNKVVPNPYGQFQMKINDTAVTWDEWQSGTDWALSTMSMGNNVPALNIWGI